MRQVILSAITILTACSGVVKAVDDTFFPAPIGNPLEARIGTMVQFPEKHLRLDIGASVDVIELWNSDTSGGMRIGADFMTYTRLRSEGNFKFPVETADFYFGINATYTFPQSPLHARIRLAHISSHLVDGAVDSNNTFSTDKPFVYSREFAELLFGYTIGVIRPYVGGTFLWAVQPSNPNRFIPQLGFDIRYSLTNSIQLRAGYDWKLVGVDGTYVTQQAAQAGVFFDTWKGRGLSLNVYGYNGRSMHGMYYNQPDSYIAVGFQVVW